MKRVVISLFFCFFLLLGLRNGILSYGQFANYNNDTIDEIVYRVKISSEYLKVEINDTYSVFYDSVNSILISSWRRMKMIIIPLKSLNPKSCLLINPLNSLSMLGDSILVFRTFDHAELLSTAIVIPVICLSYGDTLIWRYSVEEDLHWPVEMKIKVPISGTNTYVAYSNSMPIVYNKLMKLGQKEDKDTCYRAGIKLEFYYIEGIETTPNLFNQMVYQKLHSGKRVKKIQDYSIVSICMCKH